MSCPINYDDALSQLQAAGLLVTNIEIGRLVRCKVEGDHEKRGWYSLHELRLDSGDDVIVGAYGVWHGLENNKQKIELKKTPLSGEQKAAITVRIREDRASAERVRKRIQACAARRAARVWEKASHTGTSEYLDRKGIGAHGARFTPSGSLVLPLTDVLGRVHGLQFVLSRDHPRRRKTGRDKEFWPGGIAVKGHFFLLGGVPAGVILICEGFATGASIFEATGTPVAVAWSANNLLPVAQALHKRYPRARVLICADDDYLTAGNPGITAANAAAIAVDGAWLAPVFAQDREGKKISDFNDLHAREGIPAVRRQLEDKIRLMGWDTLAYGARSGGEGSADDGRLRPIHTTDELLQRFSLVYAHKSTVFDHRECILLALGDMRDACSRREIHREWMEHPDRRLVRIREVGFDPAKQDPEITCNLFQSWPTVPKRGCCEYLIDLLHHLCGGEDNPTEIAAWILKWLAYPIQNPGAKMKTALVLHGPQGAGKNLFFEAVMAIYGEYGRVINQEAIEDKFNDWASRKLYIIADEVVARAELFHTKNKLKGMITGDWIRINPKNVASYEERNHVNIVFLSNETQPLILERDDRRYTVVWTPPEMPPDIYEMVKEEIDQGGVAALHDHLLNLDLGDFKPWTRPPMTRSKRDLIDISMDTTERFWRALTGEDIDGIPVVPMRTDDLYGLYRRWCGSQGYPRYAPMPRLLSDIEKRYAAQRKRCRYLNGSGDQWGSFLFPAEAPGQPPDKSQAVWLGDCSERFQYAVAAWKQAENGQGIDQ